MNISKIPNQTFGKFIDYNMWDNVKLNYRDENIIRTVIKVMDKVEGNSIDYFLRIGTPNKIEPGKLYVKLKSMPTIADVAKLKNYNPEVTCETYKRHSKWFPLDESLMYKAYEYLHKQNGYIHYCKKHPDHVFVPSEGYGKPRF